jgi:hypothetical protein
VHRYAPYYCEENVWWLAQEPGFAGLRAEVAFVTNERRTVRMRAQRASGTGADVVWDYHVVLAVWRDASVEVWDLDCTRGMPISATEWIDASFDVAPPRTLAPHFRVLGVNPFVDHFASDRRHMRRPDGGWYVEPPPWEVIGGGAHHLERFVDLRDRALGEIVDLAQLRSRWR